MPSKPPLFYGWIIVGVCFLCWLVADAFGFYTFGLFIGPIGRELGWSTVLVTGALTTRNLIAALLGPVVGHLIDRRYGARIVMSTGVLAAGASVLAASRMQEPWHFYVFYGGIGALGMVGFGGLVTHTLIAKWFVRMRGRAMGMASMGVSVGGLLFVPLAHYLITHTGWRSALLTIGIIILLVAFVPVALFVRRSPEDMDLRPDGDAHVSPDPQAPVGADRVQSFAEEYSWTLGEALRTKALWLVLVAFNIAGLSVSGVMIHFYPFLEARGIPATTGAAAMTVFALVCAAVKIPWGLVAERIPVRYCIVTVYAGCAAGLAILLHSQHTVFVFVYAVVYGVAIGGIIVLQEVLFANYFGRLFLGTIRGVVMPVNLISMAGGPTFAALLRDLTGNYTLAYTIFVVCFLLGTLFILLAKPPVPEVAPR